MIPETNLPEWAVTVMEWAIFSFVVSWCVVVALFLLSCLPICGLILKELLEDEKDEKDEATR